MFSAPIPAEWEDLLEPAPVSESRPAGNIVAARRDRAEICHVEQRRDTLTLSSNDHSELIITTYFFILGWTL